MRIGVVIVSYNPDEKLLTTLEEITKQDVEIVLVDNSNSNNFIIDKILEKYKEPIVKIVRNNRNIGLAEAQNIGIEIHLESKVEYICFFDQDSIVPMNYFSLMKDEIERLEKSGVKLGAIGPNFIDRNLNIGARYAKLNKYGYESKTFDGTEVQSFEVTFLISSGSIIPSKVIRELGTFKSEFFIDQIDTEYSMRLLSKGYVSFATNVVSLNHTIGDRTLEKIFGLVIKPNHHSSKRKYLIFRNGVKVMKLYGKNYPSFLNLMSQRFVHDILGVIFFENNKISKLKAMTLGIYDGMNSKGKRREINGLFS